MATPKEEHCKSCGEGEEKGELYECGTCGELVCGFCSRIPYDLGEDSLTCMPCEEDLAKPKVT